MRALIQRVSSASVSIEGETIAEIEHGLVIFLGIEICDNEEHAEILAEKIIQLRVFADENEKMNLSVLDICGDILVVSQFTLYADCSKGRRPSFTAAAPPKQAEYLYNCFLELLKIKGIQNIEKGRFAACMQVKLVNSGPVTILIDTEQLKRKGK